MNEEPRTYAQFWKCALQVNPHTYSQKYRGGDHDMTIQEYAESLRNICVQEKIQVVGLADHDIAEGREMIRKILKDAGIVVFPGFEVKTSEKVDWVCLFREDTSEQDLKTYLFSLGVSSQHGTCPSDLSGTNFLEKVESLGGFCYAAHVTNNNGLLHHRFNNLWKNPKVRVAQIPGRVEDLPDNFKQIVLNKDPSYLREKPIVTINALDVELPDTLRKERASIFIKMTNPCFDSFLMAFKDPESRIRRSDEMVTHNYSRIDSITVEGGYFDGLSAKISGHLNTVIGGRGTGKSTLLECVRFALDVSHRGKDAAKQGDQIIGANLGPGSCVSLVLYSAANHMRRFTVKRRYGEPPRVIDEKDNESSLHPGTDLLPGIEIYGQNEIYELARDSSALAQVLDRFLPESAEQENLLATAYRKLRENSEQLTQRKKQKDEIEQQIAQLPQLEERARQLGEQGIEDKLKQIPLLERERGLEARIVEEFKRVRSDFRGMEESLPDLVFLSDSVLQDLPHADLLQHIRRSLEKLSTALQQKLGEADKIIDDTKEELRPVVMNLRNAVKTAEEQLEEEFSKLPGIAGMEGKIVGRQYQQLLRKIEEVRPEKTRLKSVSDMVRELEQRRRNLLGEISDIRSERTKAKRQAVKRLNKCFADKMRIELVPDGLRKPLRDFLEGLPGVGKQRTEWVESAQELTILGLASAIREGKDALSGKKWGLSESFATTLKKMHSDQLYALEEIDLQDELKIELNISQSGEKQYRPLDHLSTGQQCTAILHLLLLDNKDPLIVDQPEDNLDNAFVADGIVRELRRAKTERQFLFATHNANIPVFGDAEWIGVCSVSENQAKMPVGEAQGSIDVSSIREQAASLLEGGKAAFIRRKEKYDY